MDRRCAAGALLALAACIASVAAAPTASNQTALDLYDGSAEGCYYNFQHYGEGDRIMTNEPCLNCTCHNRMLMCYLRVCPFTKPIGQDCQVEKRADQCCPIVTCPDVPVDLLTSTSTSSPAEYGETGLGKLDRYGCSIHGKYFPEGSKVPPSPNKPCEHCYCIRNMTTCVMQECTLHVDGCTPIYRKDVCCPVRYSCDHPEDEIPLLDDMTTTVRPTPGFLLTTTTISPVTQVTQDCVHDDKIFADGALIRTEKACEHCYCMKGDIVCVVQECGTPMENEGKNCTSMTPREGQCCPDTYICEGDELTTESKPDIATVTSAEDITTLSPPRRVSVEGSGYRSETDEPFTEVPTFEPDTEGSGEDQPFKPSDANDMLIPESQTSRPFITTEHDENIDQYSQSTTKVPLPVEEMAEKATTEPDKGENTVPSGNVDEDGSGVSVQDETTPETKTTTTYTPVATTESSVDTATTLPEDESDKDKITPQEEVIATEPTSNAETTIADHQSITSSDNTVAGEDELAGTTLPSRRKEDDEHIPTETATLKDLEDITTKASDLIAPDTHVTESSTSSIEQEAETTTQSLPERDNEVLVKEPSTDLNLDLTTKSDVVETVTELATTIQPEIATELSTRAKVESIETTSANPIENEIDEESFPTLAPGRIPGEGDCLLDGVTYSDESIVPSSNNCHTSCKCISSIVKCEPVVCSPAPDYMDNCQPMYDSPESCCPTYVCDHPRETVPPQSHSQMAGTESPIPTPAIECDGDQCEIVKEDAKPAVSCTSGDCTADSSKKPDECGPQGCDNVEKRPEDQRPSEPTEECTGNSCSSSPVHCADGKCETAIPKDQTCNSENGCETPVIQTCEGDNCAKPAVPCTSGDCTADSSKKPDECGPQGCDNVEKRPEDQRPSEPTEECTGNSCSSSPVHCADGKCETAIPKDQTCNSENGCETPVIQTCEGDNCAIHPDVSDSKDDSTPCDNSDGCKDVKTPAKAPSCKGESCISELPSQPQENQDCKDGNDCAQPNETPVVEECNEEGCKKQQYPDISKPAPGDCTDTECTQQDHVSQITEAPESIPRITELPEAAETKSEEPVTDLPKTTALQTEIESSIPTEASISEKEDESGTTSQYEDPNVEIEKKEPQPSAPESPDIATETPEVQQQESITQNNVDQTATTGPSQDMTKSEEIAPEVTSAPLDVPATGIPLSDKDIKEITTELPSFTDTILPEPVTKPIDHSETTNPPEDVKDKDVLDITTEEPAIHDVQTSSPEISEGTTESQEILTSAPESLDKEQHEEATKEPEYVQDTEPKVTEPDKAYTTTPEQISTVKLEEEPVKDDAPTTPKSHDSQTSIPETPETKAPIEEVPDSNTVIPELQTTPPQVEGNQETELPVSVSPEEPITGKPGDVLQTTDKVTSTDVKEDTETKTPVFDVTPEPHVPLDENVTQAPEYSATATEESSTKVHDITVEPESHTEPSKLETTIPHETATQELDNVETDNRVEETPVPVTVNVQTETPMSIVKEHDGEEMDVTKIPESEMSTDEVFTKKPETTELEQPLSTESYAPKPEETSSKKPVSDIEKMPSVTDAYAAATTEKSGADLGTTVSPVVQDELPTIQPVHVSEITGTSETKTSTDSAPVSVSIVNQPTRSEPSEPSVTEAGNQEIGVMLEETSESSPTTSIPREDIETKTPDAATESPIKSVTEGEDIISPTPDEHVDTTELPELTIHEHPTESSSIDKEPEQSVTEEVATNTPVTAITEPQDVIAEKDTTDTPAPLDDVTKASEIPIKEQTEATGVPDQELVTKTPEFIEPETTESKSDDAITRVPEVSVTEIQKEVTEVPEIHDSATGIPVQTETDTQKKTTERPGSQDVVTNAPKTSETEPQETITEGVAPQETVTNAPDEFASETNKDKTEGPDSHDIITPPSDTESQKGSTDAPEILDIEPPKDIPEMQDVVTTVPEITVTESEKEVTETPQSQGTTIKVSEISESDKEITEEPETQDLVTSVPKTSVTDSQDEVTQAPGVQEVITNIPEITGTTPKKDTTEAPAEDVATQIPDLPTTESVPVEQNNVPEEHEMTTTVPEIPVTEIQKQPTEAPAHEDTSTNISDVNAIEPQTEPSEAPAKQDTTRVPDAKDDVTESQMDITQTPESEEFATTAAALPETEPKKETTETPESSEGGSTVPDISETEPKQNNTEIPETMAGAPETTSTELHKEPTISPEMQDVDTKAPETTIQESEKEMTDAPEVQDLETNAPEVSPTESQKGSPETQETTEETVTEPHKELPESPESQEIVTDLPGILTTESQKELTETPVSQEIVTDAPEKSDTERITEAPEPEFITKTPERTQTEGTEKESAPEEPTVTEKDEMTTEPPLRITTKLDEESEAEQPELVTPTESSKIEPDTSLSTESGLPVEQSTAISELEATESPNKVTELNIETDKPSAGMDVDEEKPQQGQEAATEMPSAAEPTKTSELSQTEISEVATESTMSPESIVTKTLETSDAESATTVASGLSVTVKQDYTDVPESETREPMRTEATNAPVEEEVVTKAPESFESQDKTTKTSDEPEKTSESKEEYPETTPYLLILEEHTHKKDIYTTTVDEEITTSPTDIPQKEYESSTPQASVDIVTESVQSTESEKLPDEEAMSDKDQSSPEITETTIPAKITEPSDVSKEITTIPPSPVSLDTEKPQYVETNEISTAGPTKNEEPTETEKPLVPSVEAEIEKEVLATEKPHETTAPEEEFILATTKATTLKTEEEPTTPSAVIDKFGKPDEAPKPLDEPEKPKPETTEEIPKPGTNEVQPTEEALPPEDESHFSPSGTSGYGQEPDYGEEDSFGPGTCRYGGKVYVSAQQIPRDDPCDFCFCFRSDIICLQQSCPPPIHGCHEEPIQGFCCPRYECPVSMATTLNVTTTTTTTTTTLPPHFLPHAYKGAAQRRGCQIKGHTYKVGEVVRASSGPCLHCTCGGDGQMKCDPKVCTPEPMLRQMIAAAVSAKRRR